MKIIGHALVVTLGSEHTVVPDGAVAYDDKQIHAFGPTAEIKKRFPKARMINAGGKTLLPGLVNTHMHLYSTFARGISLKDAPPENFVEILERLWWRLDKALKMDDLYYSAMVPLLSAAANGVTSLIDHHASPHALGGSLEMLKKAFRKTGLRGCLCYEVSDRDGASRRDAGLEENANFLRGVKLENQNDLTGLFGLHASFTLEDSTLARAAELAKGLKTGVHIHVAEDKADLDDARKRGFRSVVDRLHRLGLTGPDSIFAHCVHVDGIDIQTLALTRTNVVHNPRSNMGNAVGCADIQQMIKEKVLLGFGTDGFSASPLPDLAVANILHKHHNRDPRAAYGEIWKMFAQNNPAIGTMAFRQTVGAIVEGAASDLVLWDYAPPTPITAANTLGHLCFGFTDARVHTTICQGKVVYENGVFPGIAAEEITEINSKSRELAQALWERF
jgi:putative selenium metabolism protein SsnA